MQIVTLHTDCHTPCRLYTSMQIVRHAGSPPARRRLYKSCHARLSTPCRKQKSGKLRCRRLCGKLAFSRHNVTSYRESMRAETQCMDVVRLQTREKTTSHYILLFSSRPGSSSVSLIGSPRVSHLVSVLFVINLLDMIIYMGAPRKHVTFT